MSIEEEEEPRNLAYECLTLSIISGRERVGTPEEFMARVRLFDDFDYVNYPIIPEVKDMVRKNFLFCLIENSKYIKDCSSAKILLVVDEVHAYRKMHNIQFPGSMDDLGNRVSMIFDYLDDEPGMHSDMRRAFIHWAVILNNIQKYEKERERIAKRFRN